MDSIVLNNVSKSFLRKGEIGMSHGKKERRKVLVHVHLAAKQGEIVCVLGKNGSGKTTLARLVSTLIEPDEGAVQVCGYDALREGHEVRKRIGVMLNAGEGGFQPRISGSGNLEYYAALYRIPLKTARSRITDLLSELGLQDCGADQYQSYSSGMRRRLALARALLPDAPVILLDEPTLGVDPWSTARIHEYLPRLAKHGKTILCTTNNLPEASKLASRLFVLEDGVLTESEIQGVRLT